MVRETQINPYYLPTSIFIVAINSDSNKLREFLYAKIAKRKKKIHPEHSARFNHDMQLKIDCIEWVLEKIEVNKIPNDRLDGNIRSMIKNLEKRKDKAMIRSDTDDLWTQIETLQWVLYVIFAIKNERMVVI
ncbi:MAG TPA: hypothetical protein VKA91_00800 [Nitrososphaeraceae archaeon]|nr:hypothetical protein [Nitrososphaeraceae archaeon]